MEKSRLRSAVRLFLFSLNILFMVPLQCLVLIFGRGNSAYILPRLWHRITCAIFNINVHVEGKHLQRDTVLFVSNHLSYLDILALGGVIPQVSFVAKEDVASWTLFGFLAKLQQTAFISRRRTQSKGMAAVLRPYLERNRSLLLFPEGTSTDGQSVYPFKSSLFSLCSSEAGEGYNHIQPITVSFTALNGKAPTTQEERDVYTWHLNMPDDFTLADHLLNFTQYKRTDITLTFHPVIQVTKDMDRKTLAQTAWNAVSVGLSSQKPHDEKGIAA